MKRVLLWITAGILALALVIFAGLVWLVETSSGARFALDTLGRFSGWDISIERVEGRLRDRLLLTGVRAARPKVKVAVDRVYLRWDPDPLLAGKLQVHELDVSGVRIQDDTPLEAKAPDLTWPGVNETVRRMDATVTRFSLKDLSYRHLEEDPSVLKELAASLALKDGTLAVTGGSVSGAQGTATGEVVAGLWRPSLRLDLRLAPSDPVADMDAFSIQARLYPAKEPEQMAGKVALAGKRKGAQRLEVTGDLGVTRTGFNARGLRLVRPGRPGSLTGKGSMTLTAGEPVFALDLKADDLDLSRELDYPARLTGTATFDGTPSAYRGRFSLANKGTGWQDLALAAGYQGNKDGLKLAPLSGRFLKGRVTGGVDILWKEGVRVGGKLAGRSLDPSILASGVTGPVNLDLAGEVRVPEEGGVSGKVDARILESRVNGRTLKGELKGTFTGETVDVARLYLAGKGFDVSGSGKLHERFAFTADVDDLSGLARGASGAVDATGWLRWREGNLSGAVAGKGSGVAYADTKVGSLDFDARLGEGKGAPVHLEAAMERLRVGRTRVERATLALSGTKERHTLQAQLSSRGSEIRTVLAGGYGDGTWRGRIERLSGSDQVGPFALAAPAALSVGSGRFALSPLIVTGAAGERLELSGNLAPGGTGSFRGSWSRLNLARANLWVEGMEFEGTTSGNAGVRLLSGGRIVVAATMEAGGAVTMDGERVELERLVATLQGDGSGIVLVGDLSLPERAGGAHLEFRSREPATLGLPSRGDIALRLADFDLALLRRYLPEETVLQGKGAGTVTGRLLPGGRLDIVGRGAVTEGHLNWASAGEEFDLSLDRAEVDFAWRDPAAGLPRGRGKLTLHGVAAATGSYLLEGERILNGSAVLRLDADQRGSRAAVDLVLDEGGELRGSFFSESPAALAIPATGDLSLRFSGIRPELLRPWLPGALDIQGELHGEANGKLLPGERLELAGQANFSQGRASWQGANGEVAANLRSATVGFNWRGERLTGNLSLALAENGEAKGEFALPIPARFPVVPVQEGIVQGTLAGALRERGFLTTIFPGLVQESRGKVDLDLRLAGTWGNPELTGRVQVDEAGAYVPSAGITLTGLQLLALLERDQIRIERFRAVSGGGELAGTLLLRLNGWEVAGYEGTLSGQRFQTVYLPELQMFTSPQLTFKGDGKLVVLRGEVGIPEMLILGQPVRQMVTPSGDVILEGAPAEGDAAAAGFPLKLDGRVKVVLGDKVRVTASGIDARLGGQMDLVLEGLDNITSSGEIRVVEGRYRAYGMDLEIVRGRLYYVEDPVNRPTLDILALRTVGDVSAGVTVGGFLNAPVVKLYSEPPMPEVDILAYMVLGHPMGSSGEQGALMATAAASLFSFGKSESIQEQIKDRLGLTTLGVETIDTSKAGMMGYKELPTTPGGGAVPEAAGGQSLFTVGKYLTPKLYLSYGRSLVTGENLFRIRYDLHRRWQIETQSGSESGADLYYKLEFN